MARRPVPPTGGVAGMTLEDAEAVVRGSGGRMTAAKRLMLEILHSASEPMTAEDVGERAGEVDEATVYRNLSQFEGCGVIVHSHHAHGPSVYRWAGREIVPVACEACGNVVEVEASLLNGVAAHLRDRHSFTLSVGHFALTGLCKTCARHAH
jgi:Fur family ferric uptake transcriptional regulator